MMAIINLKGELEQKGTSAQLAIGNSKRPQIPTHLLPLQSNRYMRRHSQDFFSDPLWPHEHSSTLEVSKGHSSEQSMKEEARDKEPLDSATGTNDCIAHYIKIEELSNSLELLHHDSITEEHQDQQSPEEEPQDSDGQLWRLSDQIELSQTSQQSNFPLEKRTNHQGSYQILSKQAKKFLVQEMSRTSISYVSKKYGIAANNLCRWKKSCERRRGAGRKITDANLQERLIRWIKEQKERHVTLTRKQIQTNAKLWAEDGNFKASKGWFERFARRNSELDLICFLQPKSRQLKPQRPSFFPFVKFQDHYSEDAYFSRLPSSLNLRPSHLRQISKPTLHPQ